MADTVRIEAVLEAFAQWRKSQAVLQKETDAYDGPSLGYHLSYEVDQERDARTDLAGLLDGLIDQRVDARLRELGLIQSEDEEDDSDGW